MSDTADRNRVMLAAGAAHGLPAAVEIPVGAAAQRSYWRGVGLRLVRDPFTMACAAVLLAIAGAALLAPWLGLPDPAQSNSAQRLLPLGSPGHPLGTDELGRDMLTRLIYGGRLSLMMGVLPVAIALAIGGALGLVAGFMGGRVNMLIMRVTDVFYAFPSILLAVAIAGALGAGIGNALLAITIVFIPPITRVTESVTTQVRSMDFVEAARERRLRPADHPHSHPRQRAGAGVRLRDRAGQRVDRDLGGPVLHRPGREPAGRGMGADAEHAARIDLPRAAERDPARLHDLHHLDVLQPDQRRPAQRDGRALLARCRRPRSPPSRRPRSRNGRCSRCATCASTSR
jgi:hypothetical protein